MKPLLSAGKPTLGSYNRIDSGENVIRNVSPNFSRLSCQLKTNSWFSNRNISRSPVSFSEMFLKCSFLVAQVLFFLSRGYPS